MLNKFIKISFAVVGFITGFTLVRTYFSIQGIEMDFNLKIVIFVSASITIAVLFYSTGVMLIEMVVKGLDRLEILIQHVTLYELLMGSIGLILGLIVANLITIPINRIEIVGAPVSIAANILFGCIGIGIAAGKRNEHIMDSFKSRGVAQKGIEGSSDLKLLDTSVIIDGRIVDICRSGFLEGELVIPDFVLEELRKIADSSDALKRNRGKRGLDVLGMLQKELEFQVRIETTNIQEGSEVDDKLLIAAKNLNGKILTVDYNLSKIASFRGVPVLNINELANAMKPIALPGEEMTVQVIKDGKENGQGIGYLDDGTMIVVDGGRRHMGETVNVTVTSVLQTAAGRMIFAKPKYQIERVI